MPKLVYHDSSGTRGVIELGADTVMIGRASDCQIQTQDGLVSRRHARVVYDGAYWIEDNGSANGVYVGSERVQRYKLRPGETFRCGHLEVRFEVEEQNRTGIGVAPGNIVPVGGAVSAAKPVVAGPPAAPPLAAPGAPPPAPLAAAPYKGAASSLNMPPPSPPAPVVAAPPAPAAVEHAAAPMSGDIGALRSEIEQERRRRIDAESERDNLRRHAYDAERRSDEMERDTRRRRDDAQRRFEDLQRRLEDAQRRLEESQRKLEEQSAQKGDGDGERLRRRIEQLESELRRKGGGGGALGEALRAAEAERDRLRARVTELEEKAQAPAPPAAPAAPAAEFDPDVRKLIAERDAAVHKAQVLADAQKGLSDDLERARRRVEQLESDSRRRPVGAVSEDRRLDAQRAELEAALRQLRDTERERDALREVVARGVGGPARPSQQVVDWLVSVSEGLADIRAALRAAGDELAMEQLAQVRERLRQACAQLGIQL
jgi:pSer/pThr/pTyr-binding forkhead associated (FHA) protein